MHAAVEKSDVGRGRMSYALFAFNGSSQDEFHFRSLFLTKRMYEVVW